MDIVLWWVVGELYYYYYSDYLHHIFIIVPILFSEHISISALAESLFSSYVDREGNEEERDE